MTNFVHSERIIDAEEVPLDGDGKPVDEKPPAGEAQKSEKASGKAPNPATSKAARAALGSLGGVTGLALAQGKTGMALIDKATGYLTRNGGDTVKTVGKWAGRAIPFAGAGLSAWAAYDNFKSGDIVGGVLSTLGALPVVGLPAIGASLIWEGFFDDTGEVGLWDAPDGTSTHILPASAAEIDGVADADAQLQEAQQQVFAFKDGPQGTVWDQGHPPALRLDTDAVTKAAKDWLGGVSSVFSEIESTMQSSGEPYMADYAAKLAPHLQTASELPATVTAMTAQLTAASDAAAVAYRDVLAANRSLRQQLSESGSLSDQGSLTAAQSALAAADSTVDRADSAISQMLPTEPAPVLTPAAGTVAPAAPAPAPLAPSAPAPLPGPGAPGTSPKSDEKDSVAELLKTLGKAQAPAMPQVPMGGGGNPLGGVGGGSPLGGGNPMGGNQGRKLDGGEGRKLDDKADRKLDDKERKPLEEKSDRKLSTAGGPANSVAAAPAPAGAPAGTPAVKPEAAVAKPGGPTKPNTEVDVKGEKVDFKDPKLAKMAQLLAAASPQQPMSLSDAAAASGLTPPVPHADPGRQVQPVDAKPGDILVADGKQFMLLGEGRFYDLQDFKTVGASELPQDAGSRGGYFSLNDPGDPNGGGAPVSPPAGGVPYDVPGGQPPAATVDASPAPAGAGTPAPAAPAGSGAVPSTGVPGVPAAGTGGGPGGTAGTATGTGVPKPSTHGAPLDPAAVR
ncbi:hypothetical protein H7J08_01000 [Mycobacterium frederiksbergense]|uniref:hypothetical protein n=1 Tax=Mycolicibacterium frederiksbergense TaxID=117567 RepID=UPI0021F34740|nr:hypothetical protein [Mycolicibacterium frederiksbergense]MCV7043255.1 hypothetical protein [Mycolicibacterium frederiksbergense]